MILQTAFPNQAELLTNLQLPAESESKPPVDFLEDDTRPGDVFVEIAGNFLRRANPVPRLPRDAVHLEQAEHSAGPGLAEDLVGSLIRENRVVRIDTPGGEPAIAAYKEPEVRV